MTAPPTPPRILVIAGSDSSGGAGIQADIKTITMLGGYAMTAITAITAQNTVGVTRVDALPPEAVTAQIRACLTDIGADAIKTGMIASAAQVRAIGDALEGCDAPLILDPVLIASSGARLADSDTLAAMRERLFPRTALLTPNLDELAAIDGGAPINGTEEMLARAAALSDQLGIPVLAKGGHLESDTLVDALLRPGEDAVVMRGARIDTRHTHGTGCTLASAIATGIGRGEGLPDAIAAAIVFVRAAIAAAPGFGAGHGPLGHQAVRLSA